MGKLSVSESSLRLGFPQTQCTLGRGEGVDAKGSLPHGPPSVKLIRLGICRGLDKWGARQVRQTK